MLPRIVSNLAGSVAQQDLISIDAIDPANAQPKHRVFVRNISSGVNAALIALSPVVRVRKDSHFDSSAVRLRPDYIRLSGFRCRAGQHPR